MFLFSCLIKSILVCYSIATCLEKVALVLLGLNVSRRRGGSSANDSHDELGEADVVVGNIRLEHGCFPAVLGVFDLDIDIEALGRANMSEERVVGIVHLLVVGILTRRREVNAARHPLLGLNRLVGFVVRVVNDVLGKTVVAFPLFLGCAPVLRVGRSLGNLDKGVDGIRLWDAFVLEKLRAKRRFVFLPVLAGLDVAENERPLFSPRRTGRMGLAADDEATGVLDLDNLAELLVAPHLLRRGELGAEEIVDNKKLILVAIFCGLEKLLDKSILELSVGLESLGAQRLDLDLVLGIGRAVASVLLVAKKPRMRLRHLLRRVRTDVISRCREDGRAEQPGSEKNMLRDLAVTILKVDSSLRRFRNRNELSLLLAPLDCRCKDRLEVGDVVGILRPQLGGLGGLLVCHDGNVRGLDHFCSQFCS